MKRIVVTSFGLLLAISAASPNCWAAIYQSVANGPFLTAATWTPAGGPPGAPDRGIINDNFVVTYATSATTTVGSLIVGADWPTTGELGTDGTLNMTAGKIIVTGGGDNFQIARARGAVFGDANGDGLITMTNAELQIGGSDPIVGTRDHGVLDVGLNAKVYNTTGQDNYWRLGNYGPSVDAGLEGNGLLNVHSNGTFNAHVIFIGDNDATGELRVSDTGSVVLTGNLVPRPSGFQAGGSATVRMTGSSATLQAYNLESESLAGEIATTYVFDADAGGVSPIKLTDAVNITNNDLTVNLAGFNGHLGDQLLLFDAAPNRIFGTFANVTIQNEQPSDDFTLVYDYPNGDILLMNRVPGRRGPRPDVRPPFESGNSLSANGVPEPSTMLLLGLGMCMSMFVARRRETR